MSPLCCGTEKFSPKGTTLTLTPRGQRGRAYVESSPSVTKSTTPPPSSTPVYAVNDGAGGMVGVFLSSFYLQFSCIGFTTPPLASPLTSGTASSALTQILELPLPGDALLAPPFLGAQIIGIKMRPPATNSLPTPPGLQLTTR